VGMTTPWELYYHITEAPVDGHRGRGEEVWTVQRSEDSTWYVSRPNRGLVEVNLRNWTRTGRRRNDDVDYVANPEPSEVEKRALVAAVQEVVAAGGAGVVGPVGGGAFPVLGAVGGRAPEVDGEGAAAVEAARVMTGPGPPGGGGGVGPWRGRSRRRPWTRAREVVVQRPVETGAGLLGLCAGGRKILTLLQASEHLKEFKGFTDDVVKYGQEYYVHAKKAGKELGWDGAFFLLMMLFVVLRMYWQSRPVPPEARPYVHPGGGRPSGGGGAGFQGDGYRRPDGGRPPSGGGAGGDELRGRIGNFQTIAGNDQGRPASSGDRAGGAAAAEDGLLTRTAKKIARLRRLNVNPQAVLLSLLAGLKTFSDWPLPAECDERVAPDYLAGVYKSGRRAYDYGLLFIAMHKLENSHIGNNFLRMMLVLDELLLFDGVDVINSAGVEVMCRYLYGIEKCFQGVSKRDHWAGSESQRTTNWEIFRRFDALTHYTASPEVKLADDQVTSGMQRDALFLKHLSKVNASTSAVPEAAVGK
jgi:hypothetical protein